MNISKQTNKDKILQISKELGLSHIGSNISCLPILEEIYAKKKPEDIVILDNAHAHLAHLVVKEAFDPKAINYNKDDIKIIDRWIERIIKRLGIHCDRQMGCDASGGSLGHGIGIGIGYTIANPDRTVYVIVSDGSMMEGSNWEAIRITDKLELKNLVVYCNFNGYTAVADVDPDELYMRIHRASPKGYFILRKTDNSEGFKGVQGHYKVL